MFYVSDSCFIFVSAPYCLFSTEQSIASKKEKDGILFNFFFFSSVIVNVNLFVVSFFFAVIGVFL